MSERHPKRLIEVDLPIARISAHARREKSIRHGHMSTLHIWWARRPLAACRAVTCAALWPDPADELCPQGFRVAAAQHLMTFARRVYPERITTEEKALQTSASRESLSRWEGLLNAEKDGFPLDPRDTEHQHALRGALLDFIADFANWDNSTLPAYLETSRALTQAAHESLGGMPGTRPFVVDPFAGGGSIPLEALRVGADAFASDLNPVAVLINKVVLEYIPKYGQRLADEVRKWGQWVKEQAEQELAEFYPRDEDGSTPIAYLWARTILSEAPGQEGAPIEVPMLRSLWLGKKKGRHRALRWVRDEAGQVRCEETDVTYADGATRRIRRPLLEVFSPARESEVEPGTATRGAVTCPVTGYTTPVESVRRQLSSRSGGSSDCRLCSVVLKSKNESGRKYRIPTTSDLAAIAAAVTELEKRKRDSGDPTSIVPDEQFTGLEPRRIPLPLYGILGFKELFMPRQQLALACLYSLARRAGDEECLEIEDREFRVAVQTCLALTVDKVADLSNSCCRWEPVAQCPRQLFARQAMPMVWDPAEGVPISDSSGSFAVMVDRFSHVIDAIGCDWSIGQITLASAVAHPLPDDSADAFITDPPYYYSVPYSDLSDFFYVWLRRALAASHPSLFQTTLTPKEEECVQNLPHSEVADRQKSREFYESSMLRALSEGRRVAKPDAIGTVVFAHTDTEAWESLLTALVDAGWCVTASWPIDTEMATRVIAQRQSVLGSSVHLVCRPRENSDGTIREDVGEWRDVLSDLPLRMHDWMPRLAAEGVVGADAIFACLGPALEIFSRYSRVEKASGEAVALREYLEQVWAAVSTEALSMIFKDADAAGLEPDARLTAMWLWTLGSGAGESNGDEMSAEDNVTASSGYTLEFDAARKIAQGLGIHLEQTESIVEVKADKARLLPVSARIRHLFGSDEAEAASARGRKRTKTKQRSLFEELDEIEAEAASTGDLKPRAGETVLDRVHQSMILFASSRGEALRRFLVDEGAGTDARFWKLAQSLSALYPKETDEKRWVDGVLARKKGLGL